LRVGRFFEIPTIWKTQPSNRPRPGRGREIRNVGILFGKSRATLETNLETISEDPWTILVMTQSIDDATVFSHRKSNGKIVEGNLLHTIDYVIKTLKKNRCKGKYFPHDIARDILMGWNEYLAYVRSLLSQVRKMIVLK
jgi:hypothetical protein